MEIFSDGSSPANLPPAGTPERQTDSSGHYRFALYDFMRRRLAATSGDEQKRLVDQFGKTLNTEIGRYRPVPAARRFHQSQKRIRFLIGGNRSSKSTALAQEIVWFALRLHPWRFNDVHVPNEGWFATTTWDKVGDTLWPNIRRLLRGWDYRVAWHNKGREIPERVTVRVGRNTRDKSSLIVFKAYEQGRESFQATAMRYIAFDEQFPRDIFVEAMTRIGADTPLDFMASLTPIESQPWLESRLTRECRPSDAVFECPLDDNRISRGGFIEDEKIDALIEEWPPEVRETRRLGKWGSYVGSIFQTFSREVHVVDEAKERRLFFPNGRIPAQAEIFGGIDWGGANPFCFLWGAKIPSLDNDWYVFDEYYWSFLERGGRRLQEHANEIKARSKQWGRECQQVWADHDPTDANEFMAYGISSLPADKGDDSVRMSIDCLRGLFNPRKHLSNSDWPNGRPTLHIAARCVNLLRELPMYRYAEATTNQDAKDKPVAKDDHAISALRYMLYSSRNHSTPAQVALWNMDLGPENRRAKFNGPWYD
jgi:phage terminase large subunit-like protein